MPTPLVTVIIPTHDRRELLRRAMRSVLDQTHADLELIVVDDASSDGTEDVVAALGAEDPRVRFIRNEVNVYAAEARNVGLRAAKGELIAFLDDDDAWLPDKLEHQAPLADRYSVVGCRTAQDRVPSRPELAPGVEPTVMEVTLEEFVWDPPGFNPTTMLMRKDRLVEVGGFDKDLGSGQGVDLFIRMASRFGTAAYVDRILTVHYTASHGLPRITTGPRLLEGALREIEKNRAHRSPAAYRYRLARIRLLQMHEEKGAGTKLKRLAQGLSKFDLRRPRPFMMLYFRYLLLPLPPVAAALAVYRKIKYR